MSSRTSLNTVVFLFLALAALLVAATGAWWMYARTGVGLQDPPVPVPSPAPSTVAYPPLVRDAVTLLPGLHLLGRMFPNAAYAVETEKGLVLVDTCKEHDAGPVRGQLKALGLEVSALRAILLTHAHGDHTLGAPHLRRMTGARVYAGRGDAAVLRAGTPREAFFSMFDMDEPVHPVPVDEELDGGEIIDMGDVKFHVIAAPGHTPGSVCYLMERGSLRVLFAGDTIMSLVRAGPESGPGIYTAYLSPRYRGDAEAYLGTLEQLRSMPLPDLVLPGHPAADPQPQSPHLDRERWTAMLDDAMERLRTQVKRLSADGADFLDGRPRALLPGLLYLGELGGVSLYGLLDGAGRLHLVNAPGGDLLARELPERLRRAGIDPVAPTSVLVTSCSGDEVSGLPAIVGASGCTVVVPEGFVADARRLFPGGTTVLEAGALAGRGWFDVDVVAFPDPQPAVAYVLERDGRTVLFAGRRPTVMTQATSADLSLDLATPGADIAGFRSAMRILALREPDLWLPSRPVFQQNANVYDGTWRHVLESNAENRR